MRRDTDFSWRAQSDHGKGLHKRKIPWTSPDCHGLVLAASMQSTEPANLFHQLGRLKAEVFIHRDLTLLLGTTHRRIDCQQPTVWPAPLLLDTRQVDLADAQDAGVVAGAVAELSHSRNHNSSTMCTQTDTITLRPW